MYNRDHMDLIYQSFYRIHNLNNFIDKRLDKLESGVTFGQKDAGFQTWMNEGLMSKLKACIQRDWVDRTLDLDSLSIKTKPIYPETLYGDHMTMEDWLNGVKRGPLFTDYDGDGVLATATHETNIVVSPSFVTLLELSMPDWATHVVWFNK